MPPSVLSIHYASVHAPAPCIRTVSRVTWKRRILLLCGTLDCQPGTALKSATSMCSVFHTYLALPANVHWYIKNHKYSWHCSSNTNQSHGMWWDNLAWDFYVLPVNPRWVFVSWCTSYNHIHGNHSSEGKGDRQKILIVHTEIEAAFHLRLANSCNVLGAAKPATIT